MDRITISLLNEFIKQNELFNFQEDTAFEHFCGSLVVSRHYSDSFPSEDIHVGAGGDCGIDCIGVVVNGCLVTEPEEINDLSERNGYLDVVFVFIQSERSSSFDSAKVGQFGFGVKDFFSESPSLVQNEKVKNFTKITEEILNRSSKFKKGNPVCHLYYVTTGKWQDDTNLIARKNMVIQDLQGLNIFELVSFEFVDATNLHKLYREFQNAISQEIVFNNRNVIPDIPGVEQAYLGLLPATEYLKLIENENQEIISSLFYDNVRDWQEWNSVNNEIKKTLEEDKSKIYFPLLNNGTTIVAKRINPTGNKFLLEDYQVVNGCQTSYVLHEMRSYVSEDILIPVRIIATQDENIRNSIIKATNRQTPIAEEHLFALSDFPKKLEAYFPSFEERYRLYYERRPRQYHSQTNVEKVRIINMTIVVRSFASMFLDLPHRTTRNYKSLLKMVEEEIFHKDHRLEPYYVASYAHYKLEYLFRSQAIEPKFKVARYHLLMAFRKLINKESLPNFNSHEMSRLCSVMMNKLWNDDEAKEIFKRAVKLVSDVSDGNLNRDNVRTEPFTKRLNNEIEK